jgi:hypothetical protein
MCIIIFFYYKKIEDEIDCVMKTKGAFMKIILLNVVVKHPLFKPKFDIEFFLLTLSFSITRVLFSKKFFHDSHAIQVASHRQM